jgi:V-type H+-transporting ATPase subunit a
MVSHGLVWVPKYVNFENLLENYGMRGLSYERAAEADILLERPTHFRLNDFTWPFQELINTYGVPEYKELNPTPFACVSFPFLFGIMFGDIFHGTLLTITAMYICWTHKDGSKNPFN